MQSPRGLPLGSVLQKHRAFTTLRCGRIFYIVFLSHVCHVHHDQSLTTADVEPVKQENKKTKQKHFRQYKHAKQKNKKKQNAITRYTWYQMHLNGLCLWRYSSEPTFLPDNVPGIVISQKHTWSLRISRNTTRLICILVHKCNFFF